MMLMLVPWPFGERVSDRPREVVMMPLPWPFGERVPDRPREVVMMPLPLDEEREDDP